MGEATLKLEERLKTILNVPYVVMFPSGSVSLYVALMIHGITSGDEVIG